VINLCRQVRSWFRPTTSTAGRTRCSIRSCRSSDHDAFRRSARPDNFAAAINGKTRMIFIETIGNPVLDVADMGAIAKVAHQHGLPLVVDSTFTTPYLLRPFEHGADVLSIR